MMSTSGLRLGGGWQKDEMAMTLVGDWNTMYVVMYRRLDHESRCLQT
jgi:hypothetical protein